MRVGFTALDHQKRLIIERLEILVLSESHLHWSRVEVGRNSVIGGLDCGFERANDHLEGIELEGAISKSS